VASLMEGCRYGLWLLVISFVSDACVRLVGRRFWGP
jgi:hypothetical protein